MMDETFIKMCRCATEIQEQKPEKAYNAVLIPKDYTIITDINGNQWYVEPTSIKEYVRYIWLPRQEDLQEIIENNHKLGIRGPWLLTRAFLRCIEKLIPEILIKIDMNTAWLCFVMKTCYQKEWDTNREKWVKLS